jgi:hypothetical protein
MAADWAEVTLPYGCWRGEELLQSTSVRAIDGRDQFAFESAGAGGGSPLAAGSALLARCTRFENEPVDPNALVLGDHEFLLRALYSESFASRFEALVTCGCGAPMNFDVDLPKLAASPPERGPVHSVRIGQKAVTFRLPTAADLASAMLSDSPADDLAQACTGGVSAGTKVIDRLAKLDPNAECAIDLECPECGALTTAYLDAFDLIRREFREGGDLLEQVDLLARTYGWSESDILALPCRRRHRYLMMAAA